ncbi:MAG: DUF6029 family protein [Bacteroides sp.]|jgi:hypothetical protein|nr:DUF6029 family protein [Bacteroides sp.]MDD6907605.1 DUF6029 family protein [Bacteroidaceae bacterium]
MKKWIALCMAGAVSSLYAQDKGVLTGSLESNNIYYVDDSKLGNSAANPDDHFGSNSYLKLDYMKGKFSAGIQLEGFLPALQGYEYATYNNGKRTLLGSKYISWQDDNFSFRVGDIFEQYGSGLVFRSYEDHTLGFNNSIEGVRGAYNYKNWVEVSALYGRPRLYLDYAESAVRGGNLNVSLGSILGWKEVAFDLGGSYVNRYEALMDDPDFVDRLTTNNLDMYSARASMGWKGLDARVEYVSKGKDFPNAVAAEMVDGKAILAELGYSYKNFSALGTFRKLEQMSTMLSLKGAGTGNVLNYLPSLTRQYTYMLANLNPYQVQAEGETAAQVDVYYSIRNKENRYNYWNLHANFSTAYSDAKITGESRLLWRDMNVDVEHQWNKQWKTSALVSVQEWSPEHGANDKTYASNIFVLDNTYKFNKKMSLRAELQYLYSQDYEKDWMAVLLEFGMAPRWSFSVSDMYNHGSSDIHYYNVSASYAYKATRIQLGYGRNRAGYVCSGGVCRWTPAYTGANLTITSSF